MYEIESRSDLTGAMLVVRFPEGEIDKKALYTVQADWPEFLIPFRFRCVDGEAECSYQLGGYSKLLYRCGRKTPKECVDFWNHVLQPLLDCGDWFLKPFSFVMEPQYLYTEKDGKTVSYLYIPSKKGCSDLEMLRNMAAELSQKNPSSDAELEVRILRAIMQDFQPKAFLQMLRAALPVQKEAAPPAAAPEPAAPDFGRSGVPIDEPKKDSEPVRVETPEEDCGEIHINLSSGGKPKKEKKEKKSLFGGKSEKKEKPPKKSGVFFGQKKKEETASKEIVLGAAAEMYDPLPLSPKKETAESLVHQVEEESGETELYENTEFGVACFRLVGAAGLPTEIQVKLEPGGTFTIGRYDVTVGHRQCDFEFEAKTKAVSRHHAVIEREADGSYVVIDMNSAAGTFVDGMRLTPNVGRCLERGSRVAFGTAGADYVWEE